MNPQCPQIKIKSVELRVLPMRTRFPFKYGIASLSVLPHLFTIVEVEIDGETQTGIASDGLPPKWFTKNPRTSTVQDLAAMIAVIQNAARLAPLVSKVPVNFFVLWQTMLKEQGQWAFKQGHPPLLWNFGVSLIERAVLEALCKHCRLPFHKLVKTDALGIDWGLVHPALEDHTAEDFLPATPLESTAVRHTIGLGDPIRNADIPALETLRDGLPQALEDIIPAYGLRYFKIKLSGDANMDIERLTAITEVLTTCCGEDYFITLDGNENFRDIVSFRAFFDRLARETPLAPLLKRLLWVEQPLHRERALLDTVGAEFLAWSNAPDLIIDESDASTAEAHKALKLGYKGVSHKNCKGILKGLANAALVHHQRRLHPKKQFILSGEDLGTVGPVSLTQDLAMMALLGITHVERNGHHYFRGLTMYPNDLAELTATAHPDLYARNRHGIIALHIEQGSISLRSVNDAPFGCGVEPALSIYPTLKDWLAMDGLSTMV